MALCRARKRRRIFCSPSTRIQCRPRVYRVDGRTESNSGPESYFASAEIRRSARSELLGKSGDALCRLERLDRCARRREQSRIQVDQLFNSREKRLARTPLLLALAKRINPEGCFPNTARDAGGNDWHHAVTVNIFMNKFRKLGFIKYNGGLQINTSLLSVVLHD
jgi:hypothetical protein